MHTNLKKVYEQLPSKDYVWILIISFIIFFPFTKAWFNGDDFTHLYVLSGEIGNPYMNVLSGHMYRGQDGGADRYYRPIARTIFAFFTNHGSSFSFRLCTLFIHLSSGYLLWLVLQRLYLNRFAVFFATFLFLVNPSLNTSVFWLSSTGDLLTTFFSLCALYFFLRNPGGFINFTQIWVILFYVLGLLSKEMCITLPILFFLISIHQNRIKQDIYLICTLGFTGVIFFIFRGMLLGSSVIGGQAAKHLFSFGQDTFISLIKNLYSFFVPFPPHWVWRHPSLLLIALPPILLIIFFMKKRGLSKGSKDLLFIILLILVSLLPVINIYAGWRLYFVMVTWSIALGLFLNELRHPLVRVGVFAYTLVFISVTVYWGNCYIKTGEYEKQLLSKVSNIPEKNAVILGVPRAAYTSVPVFTWGGGINHALKYFYSQDKSITIALPTTVEDISVFPEIKKISDHRYLFSLPGDGYNFFNLNLLGEPSFKINKFYPYKGFRIKVKKTNFMGKPNSIEIEILKKDAVYSYNNVQLKKL